MNPKMHIRHFVKCKTSTAKKMEESEIFPNLDDEISWKSIVSKDEDFESLLSSTYEGEHEEDCSLLENDIADLDIDFLLDHDFQLKRNLEEQCDDSHLWYTGEKVQEVNMTQPNPSFPNRLLDNREETVLVSDPDDDSIEEESRIPHNMEVSSKCSAESGNSAVSSILKDDDSSIGSKAFSQSVKMDTSTKAPVNENDGVDTGAKFDIKASMERLMESMAKSAKSQREIQTWDHKRGLPKSHSATMMSTGRSRLQLQKGEVLLKWDGTPLADRKLVRKKPVRRKQLKLNRVDLPKRGRGRPRKTKNVPSKTKDTQS